nr:MAG TPA: hypothetical protein [Caudoviricetes sp.]
MWAKCGQKKHPRLRNSSGSRALGFDAIGFKPLRPHSFKMAKETSEAA